VTAATLAGLDLTAAERDRLLAGVLDLEADATAASDLRRRWRRGERRLAELPAAVADYIEEHSLYG
jgi:nicotinic acid mononucleotide adenylyltransferase